MKRLNEIPPETEIWAGTIFREFNVGRLDASSPQEDYYDLMLIDLRFIKPQSFLLVNVTTDNGNRGQFPYLIENIESDYYVSAAVLQAYFDSEQEIYLVENWKKALNEK